MTAASVTPDPGDLGLGSLHLGPWFKDDVRLARPALDDLSVPLPAATVWLPPANGTLALVRPLVTAADGATRPHRAIAHLQRADGTPLAGIDTMLLALFTLLPDVHVRLQQLYQSGPSRPVPRQWMVAFAPSGASDALLRTHLPAVGGLEFADVGLAVDDAGAVVNGPHPMAWLRRTTARDREPMLTLPAGGRLYCFDGGGTPIDPGAVACAFDALRGAYSNLVAESLKVGYDDARHVHLVGLGDGPPHARDAAAVQIDGGGSGAVRRFSGALRVGLDAGRPALRATLHPAGTFQTALSIEDTALLRRDQLRVGVVDTERVLTGFEPTDVPSRTDATRVDVRPCAAVLHPSQAETAQAIAQLLADTARGDVRWIVPQLEGAIGALPALPLEPAGLLEGISGFAVQPLHGAAGPQERTWSPAMQAVTEVRLGAAAAGAWVHVLPLGFDLTTGERTRLRGGAGIAVAVGAGAVATVVVTLPPGPSAPNAGDVVAFDIEVTSAGVRQGFGSITAPRPARPASGSPLVLSAAGTPPRGVRLYVCETGGETLVGGGTVIGRRADGTFVAVDGSRVRYDAFAAALGARLRRGDRVRLTSPAWQDEPRGDALAQLCKTGAAVTQRRRGGLERLVEPGATVPGQDSRVALLTEAAAARAGAIVGAFPAQTHTLGPARRPARAAGDHTLPPDSRRPVPASAEFAGPAVQLTGPAALLAHEAAAALVHAATPALLADAVAEPPTTPPAGSGTPHFAAVLRTDAARVEGEPELVVAHAAVPYPFERDADLPGSAYDQKRAWLLTALGLRGPDIRATTQAAAQARFARAADRRVHGALEGRREFAPAVRHAIAAARRFIYIEGPALTAGVEREADAALDIVGLLRRRLDEVPALHVLVCLPHDEVDAHPPLLRHRQARRRQAIERLLAGRPSPVGSLELEPSAQPPAGGHGSSSHRSGRVAGLCNCRLRRSSSTTRSCSPARRR